MTREAGSVGGRHARLRLVKAAFFGVLALGILAGAESSLRAIGLGPWRPVLPNLRIEPGGKLTRPHPILGYSAIPGAFVATDESGHTTRFTHLPDGLRVTRPIGGYASASERPEVWIFGCSFTYGAGLHDEETYPWQLQSRLPDHTVVNFGMGGYGTIHSLLQLREALKQKRPEVAVLAYAGFHDVRNTFLRVRQKAVIPYSRLGPFAQPYARLDADGALVLHAAAIEYRAIPLMRDSALVNAIENAYNALEERAHDSRAVSEALVLEMHRLARAHGTRLVVADIWDGAAMLEFAARHGIATLDLALPRSPRFTLGPHDGHPNAQAARIYADRLRRFLQPYL